MVRIDWPNLAEIYKGGQVVYPSRDKVFAALIPNPRVVILGQDPYHGRGQATGLAFAVPKGTPLPPSLRNIFQELKNDVGVTGVSSELTSWRDQGVLLLNTALTVAEGKPNSHKNVWQKPIQSYIEMLGQNPRCVWVLWGSNAKAYKPFIKGVVIESVHPSPLSAHRGFFGSKPFSKVNADISGPKVSF